MIAAPDYAAQHLGFTRECLAELDGALASLGAPLVRLCGTMPEVLARLHEREPIEGLWSHEETGNALTYARDRRVKAWYREQGVLWHERPQTGVVRRLDTRDRWADRWEERMTQPVLPPPRRLVPAPVDLTGLATDLPVELRPRGEDKAARARGGRDAAEALLATFLADRACDYRSGMSSPLTAGSACSPESRASRAGCTGTATSFRSSRASPRSSTAPCFQPSPRCMKSVWTTGASKPGAAARPAGRW